MIDWTAAERRQRQQDEVWQGFTSSRVTHCAGWRQSVASVPRQQAGPLGCQPLFKQNRSSLLRLLLLNVPETLSFLTALPLRWPPASSSISRPVLNLFLRLWKAEEPNSQQSCAEDVLDELRGNARQNQSSVSVMIKVSTTSGNVSYLRAPAAATLIVRISMFGCLPLERAVQMTGGKPAGRVSFHVISSTTEKLAFNAALILLLNGQKPRFVSFLHQLSTYIPFPHPSF